MRRINGDYTLQDNKTIQFDFDVPSTWEELDPHQAATAIEVLSYTKADRFVIAASLLALLFQKQWNVISVLPDQELHALLPCTDFLINEPPPLKNFFPELKIRKKKCIAPDDNLGNIGFGEWCFAFQFYSYYRQFKDNVWLDKLISTLYRPADPGQVPGTLDYKGDTRERFNENLIEKRALDVRGVEGKFKLAIFGWFTTAVNQAMLQRPNVFPQVHLDPEQEQEPASMDDSRTWLSVFRELLGPKWGTSEQLKYTNAFFVLDALEEQKIEYDAAMKAARH